MFIISYQKSVRKNEIKLRCLNSLFIYFFPGGCQIVEALIVTKLFGPNYLAHLIVGFSVP